MVDCDTISIILESSEEEIYIRSGGGRLQHNGRIKPCHDHPENQIYGPEEL